MTGCSKDGLGEASAGPATSDISIVCDSTCAYDCAYSDAPVIAHLTFVVAIPF